MGRSRTIALLAAALAATALPAGAQARGSSQNGRGGAPTPVPAATYTTAQATRGEAMYQAVCAECHMNTPHYGEAFAGTWNGRTAYDLYALVSGTMPQNEPGTLSAEEYAAIVAYMLRINGIPAGKQAMPTDRAGLQRVKIEIRPGGRP